MQPFKHMYAAGKKRRTGGARKCPLCYRTIKDCWFNGTEDKAAQIGELDYSEFYEPPKEITPDDLVAGPGERDDDDEDEGLAEDEDQGDKRWKLAI